LALPPHARPVGGTFDPLYRVFMAAAVKTSRRIMRWQSGEKVQVKRHHSSGSSSWSFTRNKGTTATRCILEGHKIHIVTLRNIHGIS
jgi:hypothetical protein